MSHASTIKTTLQNVTLDLLKKVANDLNLSVRNGGHTASYKGYGMQRADAGKDGNVYVVSGFPGNYELAVVQPKNKPVTFQYDKFCNHVEGVAGNDCSKITQLYTAHKIEDQARLKRFQVYHYDKNGNLVLKNPMDKFAFDKNDEIKIELREN